MGAVVGCTAFFVRLIVRQVSPSIEPLASNYFTKDLAKGKFTYKNPYLKETTSVLEPFLLKD